MFRIIIHLNIIFKLNLYYTIYTRAAEFAQIILYIVKNYSGKKITLWIIQ